jgi:hypothetical protein
MQLPDLSYFLVIRLLALIINLLLILVTLIIIHMAFNLVSLVLLLGLVFFLIV